MSTEDKTTAPDQQPAVGGRGLSEGLGAWQPIATAPRDGTKVIVRGAFEAGGKPAMRAAAAKFENGIWWRDNNGYGFTVSCHPTHWMPLPPPPESA